MMWYDTESHNTIKRVDGDIIVTGEDGFTKVAQKCSTVTWESLNDMWMDDERYVNFCTDA